MMNREKNLLGLVALGLVGGVVGVAQAQPYLINISGATLQQNFFNAPASTNDYLDVDADGTTLENVAPFDIAAPYASGSPSTNHWWTVQYRATGSVEGLAELVAWGTTYAVNPTDIVLAQAADGATNNRTAYIAAGVGNGNANVSNPGGAPNTSSILGGFGVTTGGIGTGILVDIAAIDVPTPWGVFVTGGTPAFNAKPTVAGYGNNARTAVTKTGTATTQSNKLVSLGTLNVNTSSPNSSSIYDTSVALAPVAALTNLGTGLQQLKQSELRHGFTTGRLPSGENLVFVTRDSGSGTRNAFNNAIGLDPSWGVGENIGIRTNVSSTELLGPNFQASNKGGSGRAENTVINHRLAIGYSGAERGSGGYLTTGRTEILAIQNDLQGGTEYSRPDANNVLDNDANGYTVAGPAVLAHVGDPRNQNETGGVSGNTNPRMRNQHAAAYINNITRSIDAFTVLPGGDGTFFTPGEYLADRFILPAATDNVKGATDPLAINVNPNLNGNLQSFTRTDTVLAGSAFVTFGTVTLNGKIPTRTTGVTYTDGVINGANYINQGGGVLTYTQNLTSRNRIAGDFDGNGVRDINDASEMLKAYRQRNGGPSWTAPAGTGPIAGAPGTDACIEILGDFDGDGNFNAADIRYWADGLGVNATTRVLDRKAAFEAIDNAWFALTGSDNFFGTTKSGGPSYIAGESRFDIARASGANARGWAPVGADGVIDTFDLDFTKAQFQGNDFVTDGEANWSDTFEAAGFDLSADNTGDLVVNTADVDAIKAALGVCDADFNGDGFLDFTDFDAFVQAFEAGEASSDFNGDGFIDFTDFDAFVSAFELGC